MTHKHLGLQTQVCERHNFHRDELTQVYTTLGYSRRFPKKVAHPADVCPQGSCRITTTLDSRHIVNEQGELLPRWHLEMGKICQERFHCLGIPHESSGKVSDRKQNPMVMTLPAQLLSDVIQVVCSLDTCLQFSWQFGQAIWISICTDNDNWWIVQEYPFDKSGTRLCRRGVQNDAKCT